MNKLDFYNIAEKENIYIRNYKLDTDYAYNYDDCNIILMQKKYESEQKEKMVLAETISHYYVDGYDYNKNAQSRRNNYRAKVRMLQYLLPFSLFKQLIHLNKYEIADELSIDLNLVEFAFEYYENYKQSI